ncbi:MAG: hypothetical protein QOI55_908 [Actinomycetota bacterium]|nr:hypothetical protein [Actinomycetota bacterium]
MSMLSRRGWALLGAGVGLYVGGRLLGLVQLSVLAAGALLLILGAAIWVRVHPFAVSAVRSLHERFQVGVDGRVDLTLTSSSPRPTPTLAASDSFDRGRRTARFLVPPMRPLDTARAAYRVPTERRGRFLIGPLRCTLTDPFGLARRSARVLGTDEVIIHPRVHDVLALPEAGGEDLDRDTPRLRGQPDTGQEFLTLREYAPGDDLRRVHWRSTARRGTLMVRQEESRRRAPVLVVLDVRPNAHDRASFEIAVEAAASIVHALDREGRPVELVTSLGKVLGSPGRRHMASVLDELAVVEPHGMDRFAGATAGRRAGSLVAIVGAVRGDDAGALGMMTRAGGLLTIVTTRTATAPTLGRGRRVRPLLVGVSPDRPFPTAWNEAVLLWQRSARQPHPASPSRH